MDFEIIFNCPECGAEVSAQSNTAGQTLQCGACFKEITIPIPGLEEGLEIGDFVLRSKLGSGGMGEVWLATQISMRRLVALKILLPKFADNKRFVDRFLTEAAMAGQLSHPNIITAYSAGQVGNYYYLATSYIDGMEVATKLKLDTKLTEREALKITRDIAFALKYAWNEHRMLHRDVKPGNFMLDRKGFARLMDMGISKILKDDPEETSVNIVMGTPDYISPEQAKAERNIDFRSDIYSLGASLYHMVTGGPPFKSDTAGKVLQMHVRTPLTPPENINPALSKECSALIQMMMAKDPNDRQSSWDYVIDDLEAVLSGRMPGRKTLGLFGKTKKSGASTSRADDVISLNGRSASSNKKGGDGADATTDVTVAMDSNVTMKMDAVADDKSEPAAAPARSAQNHTGQTAPANKPPPPPPRVRTVPPKIADYNKKSLKKLNLLILAGIISAIVLAIIVIVVYHVKK
ncbi:MAG: serine/threonine-protein kinase [Victivallaceae bacterium]|jgi:serine/threonine-protein kinase